MLSNGSGKEAPRSCSCLRRPTARSALYAPHKGSAQAFPNQPLRLPGVVLNPRVEVEDHRLASGRRVRRPVRQIWMVGVALAGEADESPADLAGEGPAALIRIHQSASGLWHAFKLVEGQRRGGRSPARPVVEVVVGELAAAQRLGLGEPQAGEAPVGIRDDLSEQAGGTGPGTRATVGRHHFLGALSKIWAQVSTQARLIDPPV